MLGNLGKRWYHSQLIASPYTKRSRVLPAMRVLTRCRLEKKPSKPPNKQLQNYEIGINNPHEIAKTAQTTTSSR